jgi:hypothetical protein
MADRSWTGADLEQALREGSLDRAGGVVVVCMVKTAEQEGQISITAAGCERWLDVPTDMIETAELIGHRPCREHQHPLVRLTFKNPQSNDAQIFAALLSQTAQARPASAGPPFRPRGRSVGPSGLPPATSRLARQGGQGGQGGQGWWGSDWWCYATCLWELLTCREYPDDPISCQWIFSRCLEVCDSSSDPNPIL